LDELVVSGIDLDIQPDVVPLVATGNQQRARTLVAFSACCRLEPTVSASCLAFSMTELTAT
jgi:hypothetical protein